MNVTCVHLLKFKADILRSFKITVMIDILVVVVGSSMVILVLDL